MSEPVPCGTQYNTSGDPTCKGCCGGVEFSCDKPAGHDGAHFADVYGCTVDDKVIAVLRWRS